MPMQVIIVDDVHPILINGLKEDNFIVDYLPGASENEILSIIQNYEGIVVRSKLKLGEQVLSKGSKLKWIARAGSGMDNVDVEFATRNNIICLNAAEANADSVGEHTVGMLLSLMHKLNQADLQVRASIWDREGNRGVEISSKTIGIVGFGHTGKSVAKKLSGFGCKILVYDKYLENYGTGNAQQSEMDQIFEECDIITFHVPLTKETKGMVDNIYLNRFKKSIYLLNLSRGKVIRTKDLVKCMESGKVLGVALDVLENEKIGKLSEDEKEWFEYLIHSKRTLLAPHVGGWSIESYQKISESLLLKIKELKSKI
jgi:D-3-phosphoglycerate dehydrogenase